MLGQRNCPLELVAPAGFFYFVLVVIQQKARNEQFMSITSTYEFTPRWFNNFRFELKGVPPKKLRNTRITPVFGSVMGVISVIHSQSGPAC